MNYNQASIVMKNITQRLKALEDVPFDKIRKGLPLCCYCLCPKSFRHMNECGWEVKKITYKVGIVKEQYIIVETEDGKFYGGMHKTTNDIGRYGFFVDSERL